MVAICGGWKMVAFTQDITGVVISSLKRGSDFFSQLKQIYFLDWILGNL